MEIPNYTNKNEEKEATSKVAVSFLQGTMMAILESQLKPKNMWSC
jgi:hypothetical protein